MSTQILFSSEGRDAPALRLSLLYRRLPVMLTHQTSSVRKRQTRNPRFLPCDCDLFVRNRVLAPNISKSDGLQRQSSSTGDLAHFFFARGVSYHYLRAHRDRRAVLRDE